MYNDGVVYDGEVTDGKPNGFGSLKSPGQVYKGFFVDGQQNGSGKILYDDGKVYEGQVSDGKPSGTGILCYPADSFIKKFDGEFKNGIIDGQGEGWFSDNSYYKGQ